MPDTHYSDKLLVGHFFGGLSAKIAALEGIVCGTAATSSLAPVSTGSSCKLKYLTEKAE